MIEKKVLLLIIFIGMMVITTLYGIDCGDVNGEDNVDIIDALLIARYYVGLETSLPYPDVADVNNDNTIDILDALKIAQLYVGIIDELECPLEPTPEPTPNSGTVWISHVSGIQCEVTYYESVEDARSFLETNGITVLAMDVENVPVIALCGMLSGTYYKALIYVYYLEKAHDIGW